MLTRGGMRMQHTILIVDDEPDVVALLRENFTMLGYLVLTAAGCDEAVEKAAEFGYPVILKAVSYTHLCAAAGVYMCECVYKIRTF